MLLALLYQLFIFAFCSIAGFFFYAMIKGFAYSRSKSFLLHFLTGLITTTLISQVVVLWFPVNAITTVVYSGLLIVAMLLFSKQTKLMLGERVSQWKQLRLPEVLALAAYSILILIYNAGPTNMDDMESYHIQMIKWINEYGTVPGISVLHERFGFNSSWFIAIAQFIPTGNGVKIYSILNGSLSLVMGYYLITECRRSLALKNLSHSFSLLAILGLCLFSWPIVRGNAGNSNYDMITAVLVFILLLESIKFKEDIKSSLTIEWIIWPVFLFTVRIINYPFLLLSVAMLFWVIKEYKFRSTLPYLFVCTLAVLPFLTRNVLVSGYPFYPLLTIDPFQVDWKPDPAIVQERIEFTKYFNRINVMYMDIEDTKKISSPEWLYPWFKYLFPYDKPWVVLGIIGILQSILFLKRSKEKLGKVYSIFGLTLLIQVVSWLIISPDPRFIYGTLIGGSFLFIYTLFHLFRPTILFKIEFAFIGLSLILFAYSSGLLLRKDSLRNPIVPIEIAKPATKKIEIDGSTFYLPEKINGNWNSRCFDTPLPCLYIVDPRIHLRGKSIREGFRIE